MQKKVAVFKNATDGVLRWFIDVKTRWTAGGQNRYVEIAA